MPDTLMQPFMDRPSLARELSNKFPIDAAQRLEAGLEHFIVEKTITIGMAEQHGR